MDKMSTITFPDGSQYEVADAEARTLLSAILDDLAETKESFLDGCDTLVAGCAAYGVTPASNSPDDIVAAYAEIYAAGKVNGMVGDAVAGDVAKGVTFTSAAGIGLVGTAPKCFYCNGGFLSGAAITNAAKGYAYSLDSAAISAAGTKTSIHKSNIKLNVTGLGKVVLTLSQKVDKGGQTGTATFKLSQTAGDVSGGTAKSVTSEEWNQDKLELNVGSLTGDVYLNFEVKCASDYNHRVRIYSVIGS